MLEMRKLTGEDLMQSLELSQYAFQFQIPEEKIEQRKNLLRWQEIWGEFDGEQLVSKLHILPMEVYVGGRVLSMGGLAGVATWPEQRRRGSVTRLLKHALQSMKAQGQTISLLHPFDFAFYRKYGWEWYVSYKTYQIEKVNLRFMAGVSGRVERLDRSGGIQPLPDLYEAFSKRFNGMLRRSGHWWQEYVNPFSFQVAIYRAATGEAEGYLLYKVSERVMEVNEYVFLSEEARVGLWNFICQHDSMVDRVKLKVAENDALPFLLDNPKIQQEMVPYFMARIVDVEGFLKQYPFAYHPEPVTIQVEDSFAEWNEGVYKIEDGTAARAEQTNPDCQCDIRTLTALLLGVHSPEFFHACGKLRGEQKHISRLNSVLSTRPTALFDFF